MKFKRILSLLITLMMILSVSSVGFSQTYTDVKETDDYYEAVEALSSLGIIKGYDEGDFKPEGKITRAEFATIIMRILGMKSVESTRANTIFDDVKSSHWASGSVASAYNAGIINGMKLTYDASGNVTGGVFEPESEVTYDQAIKMLVCALGYQKKAVASVTSGTNPFPTGYNIVAQQKRITDGTTRTDGGASRGTVAKLVYNALTVNLMDQVSYGTNENFAEIKNQSLLYSKLYAIKVGAKITNIPLDKTDKKVDLEILDNGYDDIAVANGKYDTKYSLARIKRGDVDLTGMQGLSVTAIVDISDSGEETLLCVFPKNGKNQELAIDPSLYKGINGNKICYYKDVDSSSYNSSSRVKAPFNIYLNLVNVDTATTDSEIGTKVSAYAVQHGVGGVSTNDNLYKFVDTDGDNYYDSLYIINSASFIVDKTYEDSLEIYPQNSSSVLNSSTVFNSEGDYDFSPLCLDDDEVSYTIKDSDGTVLDFSEISKGDVVTVYMSKDGSYKHYDIVVSSSKTVTGTISDVYQKKLKDSSVTVTYYRINGVDYRVNRDSSSSKLEAGSTGKFYLTDNNRIIAFSMEATVRNYAAAINIARANTNFDTKVQIQLFNSSGNIKTYNFASTYYVNNQLYKSSSADAASLKNKVAGQIIIYELNKNGEIKKLYYGSSGLKLVDEDFRLYDNFSTPASYRYSSEKLGSAYLNDNTVMVAIEDGSNYTDSSEYSLIDRYSLTDGNTYGCYILADGSKEAKFVLLSGFMTLPQYDDYPFIVTGISTSYYNGESRIKLTGYVGNKETSYILASDDELKFIDMAGNVNGNAFTTSSISTSYTAYQTALSAKKSADDAVAVALSEKTLAESNVTTAQSEYDTAKGELTKAENDLKAAKETLQELQKNQATPANLTQAQVEENEAQKAYNDALSKKNETQSNLAKALSEKEVAKKNYDEATELLKKSEETKKKAEESLKTATANLTKNNQAVVTAQALVTSLTEQQNTLTTTLLPLKTKYDTANKTYENAKANLETAKTTLKNKETLKANIEKEISATKTKSETLKKNLDTLNSELSVLEAKEKLVKGTGDSKALEEITESIKNKKTEISKVNNDYTTAVKELSNLESDLKDEETEVKKATDNVTVMQTAYTNAENELKSAKKALADAGSSEDIEKKLKEAKNDLSVAQANVATANADITTANENIKKASEDIAANTQKVSDTKAIYEEKEKAYNEAKTQAENANGLYVVAQNNLENVKNKLNSMSQSTAGITIEQAEDNVEACQTVYDSKKSICDEKEEILNGCKDVLTQKTTVYNSAVSTQTNAIASLNSLTQTSNSASLNIAKSINVNDVLQIALNGSGEITSYRHLAKYYNNSVYVMVADTNYEDSSTTVSASLVEYSLNGGVKDILTDRDTFNGKVVKTGLTMTGYGVGGRVNSIRGRSIELFDTTLGATTYETAVSQTKDISYNPNNYAYIVGSGYSKPKYSSASSVKTFETYKSGTTEDSIKKALDKTDDIVYIYKYDGDTYFVLVIDTLSNNK